MSQSDNSNHSQWKLTALTEALGDLELTIDDALSIGRGKDNDVVLGSKQISRQHAALSVADGTLSVIDLGSSNGTSVNDSRLEPNEVQTLSVDDVVSFAVFSFKVGQNEVVAPVVVAEPEPVVEEPVATETPIKTETVEQISEEKLEEALEAELEEPVPVGNPNQETAHTAEIKTLENSKSNPVVENTTAADNSPEHFAELAKEADPEVQKAKQAATAKPSGTEKTQVEATKVESESFNTVREQEQHSVAHVKKSTPVPQNSKKGGTNTILWTALILLGLAAAMWLFNSGALV